jgi:alkaline phosphatase
MKRLSTKIITLILTMLFVLGSLSSADAQKKAKYVFFFIGDGMGFSHISLTEAYLAAQKGVIGSEALSFTKFPVMGMATTYSASNPITCSSAAGTALSTGFKTKNHMLGVTPDTSNLTSISYKIHAKGIPVGIMTTVTIDHATPGAFYAHSADRNDYYTVARQLPESGFEFFGGGGFQGATPAKNSVKTGTELNNELLALASKEGYKVAYGVKEYNAKKAGAKKMILFQQKEKANGILPYALFRKEGDLTLTEVLKSAIDFLDKGKGFFIMAEGGKIDWAAHSNDVANTIYETIDMSNAIEEAYKFYLKHPDETLIIVTADHETGGVSLGRKSGYVFDLSSIVKNHATMSNIGTNPEDYMKVVPADSISKKTQIGWTTTSHTGGAVPVFAVGVGSEQFAGRQDNTDIPKKVCKAMGIKF